MSLSKQAALACATLLLTLTAVPSAQAVILTHVVGPMDNLYNTPWVGNPFPGGIGDGTDARSVESGGSPFDFSGYSSISVTATGCIVDAATACTGPDGLPPGTFQGPLIVYSMIGLWSSTGSSITAIGSPFNVGSAAVLAVPGGPAYLFLAENDGIFSDNTGGHYDVTIEAVPEPGTLLLLASGIATLAARRRRRI